MGCCRSSAPSAQVPSSGQEKILKQAELECPLSGLPVRSVCAEFLANDRDHYIPIRNLQRICDYFSIPSAFLTVDSAFSRSLRRGPTLFITERLLLCQILLGQGSLFEKTQIWFDFYDRKAKGSLDMNKFRHMLSVLLDFAINSLPLLAAENIAENDLKSYINELNACKESYIKQCMDSISEVTVHDIMKIVMKDKILFSDTRNLILKEGKHETEITKCQESNSEKDESYDKNSDSDSDDSDDSIVIQVRLSDQQIFDVVIHPDDNPKQVVEEFSSRNSLTKSEKYKLLNSINQIHDKFAT